jgi:hypothetical protein
MGESSAKVARAQSAQTARSGATGEEISQGVVGKSITDWLVWILNGTNKQGRMGDFMGAALGRKLTPEQYKMIAALYKDWPNGPESMMLAICATAIKDPKGNPLEYLMKIKQSRASKQVKSSRKEGFSRDDYVES